MTRRRLYNPAQLTPDELKASFVARQNTLADMLRVVREQESGHPCQHMMLIGPRGMGKTTLGLRLIHEILDTPTLAAIWQPVAFYEESYGICNLAEFWLAALNHLTRATEDPRWAKQAESLARDERDESRLAAYALAALMDFCQASGKRLILFVENIDSVFKQLGDERQTHELRATLIERPEILLIGSANTVFEAIQSHGEPLYEFFRLFILKGLCPEDTRRILATLADEEGRPEVMATLDREHGRLETIRRMTDGNPRLVVLTCRILIESPLGPALEALERLIDEQTPYFKARIEELPIQARKVFHCLAERWRPMLAREVADAAKLSSSHASAQLKQLIEKGYAREMTLPHHTKGTLYEVSDRFYNIYYLLRFSRAGRERLTRLIAFLHDLFGLIGMRAMYPETLEQLRIQGSHGVEPADLLGILADYVARDKDFTGREDWRRQALVLAYDIVGPNSPVVEEILEAFAAEHSGSPDRFTELINRGVALLEAGHFEEAEAACRKAIDERPNDAPVWTTLGWTLMKQERFEDAIAAFERVLDYARLDDTVIFLRVLAIGALACKAISLFQLKRYEAATAVVKEFGKTIDKNEPAVLRSLATSLYCLTGYCLAEIDRSDEAIQAWELSAEYARVDDSANLRHLAAESLKAKGEAIAALGRHQEGIGAWTRAAAFARVDDPPDLRRVAANSLRAKGDALSNLGSRQEALEAWGQGVGFVRSNDPPELRHTALATLFSKSGTLFELNKHEEWKAACLSASDYVSASDPRDLRGMVATILTTGAALLNRYGKWDDAEAMCRRATNIEPTHDASWRILAEALVGQADTVRLAEAEDCAKRAVELAADKSAGFRTLFDVLAHRGNWTEALGALETALRVGSDDFWHQERAALTASLIKTVAAGHCGWVKRMMEEYGLAESMEPLWHAVRTELGEKIEPLPAEIMDAVNDIRREFAGSPNSPSEATSGESGSGRTRPSLSPGSSTE